MTEIKLDLDFGFSLVAVITRYKKEIPADLSKKDFDDGACAELDYQLYIEDQLWKRVLIDDKQFEDQCVYESILDELEYGDYDEI